MPKYARRPKHHNSQTNFQCIMLIYLKKCDPNLVRLKPEPNPRAKPYRAKVIIMINLSIWKEGEMNASQFKYTTKIRQ